MRLLLDAPTPSFAKGPDSGRLRPLLGLFFLPIVAFGGYTVMLVFPGLSLIRLAKG